MVSISAHILGTVSTSDSMQASADWSLLCAQDTRQQLQGTQQQLQAHLQDLATQLSGAEGRLAAEPAKQRAFALQVVAALRSANMVYVANPLQWLRAMLGCVPLVAVLLSQSAIHSRNRQYIHQCGPQSSVMHHAHAHRATTS